MKKNYSVDTMIDKINSMSKDDVGKRKYSSPATMCSIVKKSKIGKFRTKMVEVLSLKGRKTITIDGSNYVNQMEMLDFPLEGQTGISASMYQFGKEESKTYDELYDEIIIQNFKTMKRMNFNKIKDDASNLREVSWGTGIARISFRGDNVQNSLNQTL